MLLRCVLCALAFTTTALAQEPGGSARWGPQVLGTQVTVIGQALAPFRSPYAGSNSLVATGDAQVSHTYGVYLGQRIGPGLHAYLDVEMARGSGIGHTVGLAGITNGDIIRQGTTDLGQGPYVARAFLRYLLPLGSASDTVSRAMDQLPGAVPRTRLEIQAGKFAVTDMLDVNRYANSTRLQFMNWALINDAAWDYAADTRGYTNGVAVAYVRPSWSLRAVSAQMPRQANGNIMDPDIQRARGDNIELTIMPPGPGTVVRVLAYRNHARMGRYDEAVARASAPGAIPDVVADDAPGRMKSGFAVNLEQPLADSGETGAFARVGWNDGATESFVFTEADRHASVGIQATGASWHRASDRAGAAVLRNGISTAHREYLAAGGRGFLLGDGRLTYGPEDIAELYYRLQLGGFTELSPDLQLIRNPGYNRDRGPVRVLGLRVNLRY